MKGALILGLAMLSFSASSALVKVACAHVPVMEVVFVRGIFGAIILFAQGTRVSRLRENARGCSLPGASAGPRQ